MAHFLFADESIVFDGQSIERGPLGGAESAFISMCEALAKRGHKISVRNKCLAPLDHNGVSWRPLGAPWPQDADVYVANRGWQLIDLMPDIKRRIFWIHNPANYLLKFRYFHRIARYRPSIVFSGQHHADTYPPFAPPWLKPNSRIIIPYGISKDFLGATERINAPSPKVIFTSNPLRSLDWLLQIWQNYIHPALPQAELHIFSGASTYKAQGTKLGDKMEAVLNAARAMQNKGVILRDPIAKPQLREELYSSRALLYRGDVGETFCLAVGEAQAMGVPAIVQPVGCVAERVVDGQTGYVAHSDEEFAGRAIRILQDDTHWMELHRNAIRLQQAWTWDRAAAAFEAI
ncbi:MAG: glycosyltransferase family 1 protein [Alphaproteobacteria bacterium]|nr:MAG: glycosyltransferase family 1 protein [Alphaproteobacteria bacterium]